jgi:hypothetical protein
MIQDRTRILQFFTTPAAGITPDAITAPGDVAPRRNMARHVPGLIAAFVGQERIEGGLALDAQIPRDRLDSRTGSLPALDEYLLKVRASKSQIDEKTMTLTVLAAGCYLGEVIRHCSPTPWEWVNYDDRFPRQTRLASIVPYSIGTCIFLEQTRSALTLPIHQVGCLLKERETAAYTTHAYAQREIARASG